MTSTPQAKALWQGRRVFVTGHTGFTGAWLCRVLLGWGATVMGYSLAPPSEPNLFDLTNLRGHVEHRDGDVRDLRAVTTAMHAFDPHVVLHLAAQTLVLESYREPIETFATNVMGTVNVLEALRSAPSAEACVIVTSDKCYENREWVWGYREHEPMGGHDPYSNSKGCAELVTAAYRNSFDGPSIASGRAGNVIGGGDWAEDRLIPDVMNNALAGRPVPIRNPDSIRPWQHVLNPLSGYLLLAERLWQSADYAEPWNFGPADEDARSVRWIVERLAEAWDGELSWETDAGDHPHEATHLKVDSSKARSRLGWAPTWDLGQTLASIAHWYRGLREQADLRALSFDQIAAFEAGRPSPS
jgi:CDP-glucose 4,6-dehydratase